MSIDAQSVKKEFFEPPLVPADPDANITEILEDRVRATPDNALFAVPENNGWRDISAAEFRRQVIELAKGFVAAGLEPGERIGFIAKTTYEWTLVDFALFYAGIVMVPIYETSSPAQIQWDLSDSGAVALLAESSQHARSFAEVKDTLPLIRRSWVMSEGALDELRQLGRDVPDAEIERRRTLATSSDMATIIYTSGSTGRPKGCVLTHGNFVELTRNTSAFLDDIIGPDGASTLLFITTAHVFARFISILNIHGGAKTGHQSDTSAAALIGALQSFRPTYLLAVPRVFEKIYNTAEQMAEKDHRGGLFRAAARVAIRYSTLRHDKKPIPLLLRLQFLLAKYLVLAKVKRKIGSQLSCVVSGSAPLGSRLAHFYSAMGIMILEGYGLTETTAPATVNRPQRLKIGTVGVPLPGVGIRLGEGGEIEVRGINVFSGYWKNESATVEAFEDGWFRTGDIGEIDDEGFLTITGRKKELIITAGGKNVAPAPLEDIVRANPVVADIVVVGDQRPFIAALVTLDTEMLPTWLANNGLDPKMSLEEASKNPKIHAEVEKAIAEANTRVSRAESIRKFTILPTRWTEESGHLTPSLKIKRFVILKDFAREIEELYTIPVDTANISLR